MWKSSHRVRTQRLGTLFATTASSFSLLENDSYTLDCNQKKKKKKKENKNKLDGFSVSSFMWNAIHMLSRNQRYC